jgi:hypothetical protein
MLQPVGAGSTVCTAQQSIADDHGSIIFQVGAAGEASLAHGTANFGPNLAAEITPIEDWLEIEAGVSALVTTEHTELSEDLVFKKPFRLTLTAELMIGLGPFFSHTSSGPDAGSAHGAEIVFDFMFWPRQRRGWYVEPSWSHTAGTGKQAIALTAGYLLGWR